MAKTPSKVQQPAADAAPAPEAEVFDPKPVQKNLRARQLTMGQKKD